MEKGKEPQITMTQRMPAECRCHENPEGSTLPWETKEALTADARAAERAGDPDVSRERREHSRRKEPRRQALARARHQEQ